MSFANYFKSSDPQIQNNSIFIIGRVINVVYGPFEMDGKTPEADYNDPTDIGKIRYVIVNSPQYLSITGNTNPFAKPAWPHLKQLPLLGEYVYIIPGPSPELNDKIAAQEYYYLPPFGLWSSPHHNAMPALDEVAQQANAYQLSYEATLQGNPNSPGSETFVYPLGHDFIEKPDVKALRPFVGDVTLEGRWGNSIRFGSSLKSLQSENNWARSNNDGDPILIIRNGQGAQTNKQGWVPTTENINNDNSSIYLTAGQEIIVDDLINFPLNSFEVNIQQPVTTVKTLTTVPTSNSSLSPQFQDNFTVTGQPTAAPTQSVTPSFGTGPDDGGISDNEYRTFYLNWRKQNPTLTDDGFDAFFNYLKSQIQKPTIIVPSYQVIDAATGQEISVQPFEGADRTLPIRLQKRIDEGKVRVNVIENYVSVDDIALSKLETEAATRTRKVKERNTQWLIDNNIIK